jgi:lipopolysaccharide/colanic/teichoic acid biosynthesis glycosyltransferase
MHLPQQILHFGTRRNSRKRRIGALLRSNRFALVGAFIFAVLIPELLHPLVAQAYPRFAVFRGEPELYASVAALLMAHVALRRVGVMPLVNDRLLVLPTFLVIFAAVGMWLSYGLGEIGRYHLVTSFLIGIVWYQFVAVLRARTSFPRLAWIGSGPIDEELATTRIDWVVLYKPHIPKDVLGVVFDKEHQPSDKWERFFAKAVLRNIPVYDVSDLREMTIGRVRLHSRPELVFGQLLPSQPYLRVKRIIDTAFALPALFFFVPVLLISAVLLQIGSPGPVFFRQRRIGYQGRPFTCYKLRTMRVGVSGPQFTTEDDPRITFAGKYIRKWRIDEIPQILNIIRGEMSWIGPRPESFALARQYERAIPYYAYRYAVRPGISGWAAVHQGNVAMIDAATLKLEYDFFYIKYFSLSLDFLIALMTIRTVATGFGSR